MNKLVIATLSALSVAATLAATPAMAAPPDRHGDWHDNHHGDWRDRDWRHDRSDWRDERREARWDAERHNGYWWNNHWYYGPPPTAYYGRPGFALGYHPWARGAVLPRYYFANRYYIDYRRYHLRRPPHGYNWVRDERGDFVLAAIASGIIADIIVNSH